MIDLADAGRRLARWDAGEPTDLSALRRRARSRRLRHRIAGGALGATAAAALIAGAVLVSTSAPTVVRVQPAERPALPAAPLPPVPKGWVRVFAGPVALASPSGNVMVPRGGPIELCAAPASDSKASGCAITGDRSPRADIPVVVSRLEGRPVGTPRIIDGLRVLISGTGERRTFFVPALGVQIETFGPLGRRIAETLAPSPALVVASEVTAPSVPASWHTVGYGAITISVPPSWPVVRLRHLPLEPGTTVPPSLQYCDLFTRAELDLGDPPGRCGPGVSNGPEGLWLGRAVVAPAGLTHTTLAWVEGAQVDLAWAADGSSELADLTIRTDGATLHATVALGDDPATIVRVLASIRSSADSASTAVAGPR